MGNILGFAKRLHGANRIKWSVADIERLRAIYDVSAEDAAAIVRAMSVSEKPTPVVKSAPDGDLPTKWRFTASDGKVDRVGDVVSISGIHLKDFLANPIWHHQHNYTKPIGRSIVTEKVGGKLKSTLELAVGILPDADALQRMLGAGVISACSIGFDPVRWTYNKARDGIDFHEISLIEISTVTVPCCAGAVLDGPVKSLTPDLLRQRRARDLDLMRIRQC
ncbi:MAG: HK97 family phage prohead protease [Methyloceanibacter sp.]